MHLTLEIFTVEQEEKWEVAPTVTAVSDKYLKDI
jgi:hypothetical protein